MSAKTKRNVLRFVSLVLDVQYCLQFDGCTNTDSISKYFHFVFSLGHHYVNALV